MLWWGHLSCARFRLGTSLCTHLAEELQGDNEGALLPTQAVHSTEVRLSNLLLSQVGRQLVSLREQRQKMSCVWRGIAL